MPKVTLPDIFGIAPAEGFSNYAGPTPPRGVYRCKTGLFRLTENSSGDQMYKIIFEIDEPAGSKKAKYNGYAIWHNANLTEKSAPFVNAMLQALGIPLDKARTVVTSKDKPEDVLKIGGVAVRGLPVIVTGKLEEYPVGSGDFNLKAASFAPAGAVEETSSDDNDDDDDDDDTSTEGTTDSDDDSDDDDSF